jgi:hypothetical protein
MSCWIRRRHRSTASPGQADDVEGIHHRHRVGQLLAGGGLEPGEPVHRDHLHAVAPGFVAVGEPGLERLLGAALDHVQQPGRPSAVTDPGQVDDHGDVLVAAAGVPPHVLIDADDLDAVEPGRVVDQDALAFGQHRVVGGAPRHPERFGRAGDGQVLHHDRLQRPPQPTPRQLRSRLGGPAGVLPPDVPAAGAAVAAHGKQQRRRSPAVRLMRQLPHDGIAGDALATAATAPLVRLDDLARQERTVRLQALTGHDEAELVEPAQRGQVREGEPSNSDSVRHVEVFQMDGVGTSILGRPRPLSRPRRADRFYTLIWEEPDWRLVVLSVVEPQESVRTVLAPNGGDSRGVEVHQS